MVPTLDPRTMFRGLSFTKSATDIIVAATKKVTTLKAKITEREQRIVDLRKEYDIDDSALIQLLTESRKRDASMSAAMTYSFSKSLSNSEIGSSHSAPKAEERIVGAGVVNNLLTENDFIENEKEQVKSLELIARNLKAIPRFSTTGIALPDEEFKLTQDELTYLGF
jgi:hypothetical protein